MKTGITHTRLMAQLIVVVGLAQSAFAQPGETTSEKRTPPETQQGRSTMDDRDARRNATAEATADYRSANWLRGRDVVNANEEDLGDVTDLIIERGSGRIKYVVIKAGSTRLAGSRSVAVPYRQLFWSAPKGRFVLPSGANELNAYPEFTDEQWDSLRMSENSENRGDQDANPTTDRTRAGDDRPDSRSNTAPATRQAEGNRDATGTRRIGQDPASAAKDNRATADDERTRNFNDWMWNESSRGAAADTFSSGWNTASRQRIEGTVKNVTREQSSHGEEVVIEVAAQDGSTKRVNVGPAWFVSGGEAPINRGDKIILDVVPLYVATSTTVNGREVKLRDEKGSGIWGGQSFTMGKDSYSMPYYRHVRLTKLNGADLDCRGTACGKINDVIIEANSGSVAFLSIDPNQNFLGIADTKRMVPWSVATVAIDGTVRIDAGKEMVLASLETPSDISSLNGPGRTDSIYSAYQVSPRRAEDFRDSTQSGEDARWNRNKPDARRPGDRK